MRHLISLLLAALLPVSAFSPIEETDDRPSVHALSAVLMAESGEYLYEQNAAQKLPIASTTKLMTALVVVESCGLDDPVEILPEYCGVEGSSMYLRPGERYSVRELLTGLLLASGNDAAVALACFCSGDIASFSEKMNRKAELLGMHDSHFLNPHGLTEPEHYSTARDLALLMREAMHDETLSSLLGLQKAVVGGQTFLNHNKLLTRYPGCIGGKTGYTELAGRCLVSCAERDGLRLICVTLKDPDDWTDQMALYDWGFSHFLIQRIDRERVSFDIPLLCGTQSAAVAIPEWEEAVLVPRGRDITVRTELPFYVFAPVSRGSAAGRMTLYLDDRLLCEIPLVYLDDYPNQ